MNWWCYFGSRYQWLQAFWPLFGHRVRFRGLGEVYCDRCQWTDLY